MLNHPLIELLNFFILSAFLSQGNWVILLLSWSYIFYQYGLSHFSHAVEHILRLRWLFFSLVLLYLVFLPWDLFLPLSFNSWLLLKPLIYRLLVLATMIVLVSCILETTPRKEIIAAIYLLLYPLKKWGVDPKCFLLHTYLTLVLVKDMETHLFMMKQQTRQKPYGLSEMIDSIRIWFEEKLNHCPEKLTIHMLERPKLSHWLSSVVLLLFLMTGAILA